jgi:nucleotide-binding universal stress UspA family protein
MDISTPRDAGTVERWYAFTRVLAAASLDRRGLAAVLRAAALPLAPGARVTLLHAIAPPRRGAGAARGPDAGEVLERFAATAGDVARAMGAETVRFVARRADGEASDEIVRAAWRERAEIVVLGAPASERGASGAGAVARVMRTADLPILVARGSRPAPYRRVLCAVDGAITAVDTLALALRLAAPAGELILLRAYHVPFDGWLGWVSAEVEAAAESEAHALAALAGGAVSRVVVRRGEPRAEILRAAVAGGTDLVVLGTHGRTGIARALLGSVAEWVIGTVPCDVAVSRPHRVPIERH